VHAAAQRGDDVAGQPAQCIIVVFMHRSGAVGQARAFAQGIDRITLFFVCRSSAGGLVGIFHTHKNVVGIDAVAADAVGVCAGRGLGDGPVRIGLSIVQRLALFIHAGVEQGVDGRGDAVLVGRGVESYLYAGGIEVISGIVHDEFKGVDALDEPVG